MRYCLITLIFFLTYIPNVTYGYLMTSNQRIDHVLYEHSDARIIVHASITKLYKLDSQDTVQHFFYEGPEVREMDFRINKVILGKGPLESATLHLPVDYFMWPDDLVMQQVDHELILILSRSYADSNSYYLEVVIPVVSDNFETVFSKDDAKKLLAKKLVKVAESSVESIHIRAVLQQLGPILPAQDAEKIIPFLTHEDAWVKRAAMAALVYATEDPKVLRLAAEDIQQFISTTDKDSLIKDIHPDYQYAPYPFYKQYMFFIQSYCWKEGSNWSPEQTDKDCRIVEKILTLGILDKRTLQILEHEF